MLSNNEFLTEINGLIEAFPSLKNRARLARIYFFLQSLPQEAAKKIIQDVGDSAKSTPTPNDFREMVSVWKKSYYAKHGNYYGAEKIENKEAYFCTICNDAGVVELYPHGKETMSHHMRCGCIEGLKHWSRLPEFDKALKQGFRVVAPALTNFKPTNGSYGEILEKYKTWRSVLNKSENHWKLLGYEHV